MAVSELGIEGDVTSFLKDSEILVLNIPPKLRGVEKEDFVAKTQIIAAAVEASSICKVLLVSSTSVYADCNEIITENTIPHPDSESGRQLLKAEQLLQSKAHFQTTVLRFGGLIGNERHPIRFFSRKKKTSKILMHRLIWFILKIVLASSKALLKTKFGMKRSMPLRHSIRQEKHITPKNPLICIWKSRNSISINHPSGKPF